MASTWLIMGSLSFPGGAVVKNPPVNAGDIRDAPGFQPPGWEDSPGGGNGNPLQYTCLENPMDRGAWWATVFGVTKSQLGDQLKTNHKKVKYAPLINHMGWSTSPWPSSSFLRPATSHRGPRNSPLFSAMKLSNYPACLWVSAKHKWWWLTPLLQDA